MWQGSALGYFSPCSHLALLLEVDGIQYNLVRFVNVKNCRAQFTKAVGQADNPVLPQTLCLPDACIKKCSKTVLNPGAKVWNRRLCFSPVPSSMLFTCSFSAVLSPSNPADHVKESRYFLQERFIPKIWPLPPPQARETGFSTTLSSSGRPHRGLREILILCRQKCVCVSMVHMVGR